MWWPEVLGESISFVDIGKGDDSKKEQLLRQVTMTQEFKKNFDEASNRICRALLMEPLFPLYSVTGLDHFKEAVRDLVLVHHFLHRSKYRILYRDISLRNLMVRFCAGGDKVRGVLIDFDLASVGEPKPEGHRGRRTGTRPYMARDLLAETPVHLERYDWESFFYVICWIASHYSNGDEVETDAFNEWDQPDDKTLSDIKTTLLWGKDLTHLFTEFYRPLVPLWTDEIQSMFYEADQAKKKESQKDNPGDNTLAFDQETLGGHITWERFWGILKR